jgi:hypothetical protein
VYVREGATIRRFAVQHAQSGIAVDLEVERHAQLGARKEAHRDDVPAQSSQRQQEARRCDRVALHDPSETFSPSQQMVIVAARQ